MKYEISYTLKSYCCSINSWTDLGGFSFCNHELVFLLYTLTSRNPPPGSTNKLGPSITFICKVSNKGCCLVTMTMRPGNLYKKPSLVGEYHPNTYGRYVEVVRKNDAHRCTYYRSLGVDVIPQQKCCILVSLILTPPPKTTTPFGRISVFSLATSTDTGVVRKDVGLDCSSWHPLQKTKYIRPQLSQMRIFT